MGWGAQGRGGWAKPVREEREGREESRGRREERGEMRVSPMCHINVSGFNDHFNII